MKELAEFRASLKCEDREAACSDWASRGDCLSNAPYLVRCLRSLDAAAVVSALAAKWGGGGDGSSSRILGHKLSPIDAV